MFILFCYSSFLSIWCDWFNELCVLKLDKISFLSSLQPFYFFFYLCLWSFWWHQPLPACCFFFLSLFLAPPLPHQPILHRFKPPQCSPSSPAASALSQLHVPAPRLNFSEQQKEERGRLNKDGNLGPRSLSGGPQQFAGMRAISINWGPLQWLAWGLISGALPSSLLPTLSEAWCRYTRTETQYQTHSDTRGYVHNRARGTITASGSSTFLLVSPSLDKAHFSLSVCVSFSLTAWTPMKAAKRRRAARWKQTRRSATWSTVHFHFTLKKLTERGDKKTAQPRSFRVAQ